MNYSPRKKGLSEERKQKIQETIRNLDILKVQLQSIIDNESTQSLLAEQIGVRPQELNRQVNTYFTGYIKNRIMSPKDFLSYLVESETAVEKLVRDIFEVDSNEKFAIYLDPESEEELICNIKKTLSEREYKILSMYYGLEHENPHTYEEIGDIFSLTRSRVGQLIKKSLRILRNPVVWETITPEYKKYIKMVSELENSKSALSKLDMKSDYILKNGKMLISIEELDGQISRRLYRVLRRNGIYYLNNLENITKEEICSFRNFGKKTMDELLNLLPQYNIHLKQA